MAGKINLTDELKKYFGFNKFKGNQEAVIRNVLEGKDTFVLMPTGGGKSLTYQVPTMARQGLCIVVTPLIALMKDQVDRLRALHIPAVAVHSGLSPRQIDIALDNCAYGDVKFLYVAPERLSTDAFRLRVERMKVTLLAVDEAHCISQWGYDFRPSYLRIAELRRQLPGVPVLALTASATPLVAEDIMRHLDFAEPHILRSSFARPNLSYSVRRTEDKNGQLLRLLRGVEGCGIVYVRTREGTEQLADLLRNEGITAAAYHGGLGHAERTLRQEDWMTGRVRVMVATNAFGMGIDKSNVSYVIHYNMPKNIESYYQEAGRAGRDGGEADCILLYSPKDVRLNRFMIENSEGNDELTIEENEQIRERDFERLKHMTFYSTTNDCLRGFILRYFGGDKKAYCGKCSNCLSVHKLVDVTIDAQKIMSCIARTGQRYGKTVICDVLKGSKSEKILKAELNNQSTYGIMKEVTARHIFGTIDFLAEKEYISADNETEALKLLPKSRDVLFGRERLVMKKVENSEKVVKTHRPEVPVNADLLDALKALRKSIASKKSVPAYVIFSDATLIDMCKKCPETSDEMLEVSGVGRTKLEKFGKEFLEVIAKFR